MPLVAAVLVGLASLVPATFPVQGLVETLVIAQASLLAIVLSVAMMSTQVSTNRFAPQLAQLYRDRSFTAIVARFGLSILLDLLLFALPAAWAGRAARRAVVVGLAVGLAAWAFVTLLEIEDRLLVFLNPDPVLESLVESASFERYRAFALARREEGQVARNPVLEIVQIAQTSLEQRDAYGALRAVDALDEATERLLSQYAALPAARREETAESVHKLFDYWNRIADLAVERGADDVLHAVVDAERAVGEETVDLGLPAAATGAVDALFQFCAVALANNRLEPAYTDALGDLLAASVTAGLGDVTRRGATDLARLARLVDRREDDLLVAGDERVDPLGPFFDGWARVLATDGLDAAERRALYRHFEREYGRVREEATADDRLVRAAASGLRGVGVAAARADRQWAASRAVEYLVALARCTDRSPDALAADAERIIEAGGQPGVRDAVTRLRSRPDAATATDTAGDAGTDGLVADPLSDGATPSRRPVRPEGDADDLAPLLDAVAAVG